MRNQCHGKKVKTMAGLCKAIMSLECPCSFNCMNVTHTSMETTTFLLSDSILQLVKQMNVETGKRKVKRDKL